MSSETIPGCRLDLPVETLSAWRDDSLPESAALRVAQHLPTCRACQQRLREYDQIATVLRTLPIPEPVNGYSHNPRLLRMEGRQGRGRERSRFAPLGGLGTLVAALLLVVLVSNLFALIQSLRGSVTSSVAAFSLSDPRASLGGITNGPDGALYFTAIGPEMGNAIGRITPDGRITLFPLPDGALSSENGYGSGFIVLTPIALGPDGNIWFAENQANKLGRISPDGRDLAEFALPMPSSEVSGIVAGPDGNVWFSISTAGMFAGKIGRISPEGHNIVEFALPAGSAPSGLAVGPDGKLWFINGGAPSQPTTVGRITSDGRHVDTYPIPDGNIGRIVPGPDGALWFTEKSEYDVLDKIGRVTIEGTIRQFPLPQINEAALDITAGLDGALWFTATPPDCPRSTLPPPSDCLAARALGRIAVDGSITLIPLSGKSTPYGIALGPDGNLWITAIGPAVIYRAPARLP